VRIAYTSDLHTDHSPENRRLLELLAERLVREAPDAFVLVGDMASRPTVIGESLARLADTPGEKLFVAGNHDVWVSLREQHRGVDSFRRLDEELPALCAEHGWVYLDDGPHRLGGTAFVGGMGWYDYELRNRARDDEITLEHFRRKSYGTWRWGDLHYARFPAEASEERLSDPALCELLGERLREHLAEIATWDVDRVVAAFHHLPYDALQPPGRLPWDFFLGFAGSPRFGRLLDTEDRLAAVLFGHVHMKLSLFTPRGVPLRCSCVGYARHWPEKDLNLVLDRSLAFIEF
jgi:predicted phosphohydrolase